MACKWWGWGEEGRTYHLPDAERFWAYIRARLGDTKGIPRLDSLDGIDLRPSRLPKEALSALARISGDGGVSTDDAGRAAYSIGKGYKDLVRIRRGDVPNPTDAVVRPHTEEQVRELVDLAAREAIAVIPFGGGTSVVGGVEPASAGPTLTLDLQRLGRVTRVDSESGTAVVEAGVFGPDLECQLNTAGFTAVFRSSTKRTTPGL